MPIAFSAVAEPDPWAVLRAFDGKWEGRATGKPGKGSISRGFRFELNGRFLLRDKPVYRLENPAAKPVAHEDLASSATTAT
jgi:hypothetical protein